MYFLLQTSIYRPSLSLQRFKSCIRLWSQSDLSYLWKSVRVYVQDINRLSSITNMPTCTNDLRRSKYWYQDYPTRLSPLSRDKLNKHHVDKAGHSVSEWEIAVWQHLPAWRHHQSHQCSNRLESNDPSRWSSGGYFLAFGCLWWCRCGAWVHSEQASNLVEVVPKRASYVRARNDYFISFNFPSASATSFLLLFLSKHRVFVALILRHSRTWGRLL